MLRSKRKVVFLATSCLAFLLVVNFRSRREPAEMEPTDVYDFLERNHSSELRQIVREAREIEREHPMVFVGLLNNAYLSIAQNWLCNTRHLNVHRQTLMIATDWAAYANLSDHWPDLRLQALILPESFRQEKKFSHVGYLKLITKRTEITGSLLEAGIDFLFVEMDWLWLEDFSEYVRMYPSYDMVGCCLGMQNNLMAGGTMYLKSTRRTKSLWRNLTRSVQRMEQSVSTLLEDDPVRNLANDQDYLNNLLHTNCCGVKYKILPFRVAASGKWYYLPSRRHLYPVFIHNNWIIGIEAKIERAKKFHHWFVTENFQCSSKTIRERKEFYIDI